MEHTNQIEFPVAGRGDCKALLHRPDGDGPFPGVLVLHDIMGFTDDLERITKRFAAEGYMAMAPDFFGGERKPMCVVRAMRSLSAQEGRPLDILEEARSWLAGQDDVDETKVGAVGFCLGGGFAVLHAAQQDLAFVGAFYGEVPDDKADIADMPPCFAGYGDRDKMFIKHGRRLKTQLDELDIANDVRIYEGVGHSYMNQLTGVLGKAAAYTPMRARYDEVASEDSWEAMLQFFATHLSAEGEPSS